MLLRWQRISKEFAICENGIAICGTPNSSNLEIILPSGDRLPYNCFSEPITDVLDRTTGTAWPIESVRPVRELRL